MGDIVRGSSFTLVDLPGPQLRKDPVTGRWTIFSTDRARKPAMAASGQNNCPFCEGNEHETPGEIMALRQAGSQANGPGWRVRVVPNRFPAVRPGGAAEERRQGVFEQAACVGSHEVIIECPHHEASIARLPIEHFHEIVTIWRDRVLAHKADTQLRYVKLFKNKGAEAGASLEHSHSQLLALPVVPGITQEEIGGAKRYFHHHGRCVFCDLIFQELEAGSRVVLETDAFLAVAAFAGRWPFETWLLPRRHASHFENLRSEELANFALTLRTLLQKFNAGLECPPYNLVLHTAPLHDPERPYYHWHFELLPRLTQPAGFEWGTGWHINPVPPEQAAAYLRQVTIA